MESTTTSLEEWKVATLSKFLDGELAVDLTTGYVLTPGTPLGESKDSSGSSKEIAESTTRSTLATSPHQLMNSPSSPNELKK